MCKWFAFKIQLYKSKKDQRPTEKKGAIYIILNSRNGCYWNHIIGLIKRENSCWFEIKWSSFFYLVWKSWLNVRLKLSRHQSTSPQSSTNKCRTSSWVPCTINNNKCDESSSSTRKYWRIIINDWPKPKYQKFSLA